MKFKELFNQLKEEVKGEIKDIKEDFKELKRKRYYNKIDKQLRKGKINKGEAVLKAFEFEGYEFEEA